MEPERIGRLVLSLGGLFLALAFAWLAFRPMPPAPVSFPPPPAFSPESPRGFRVMAILVEGANEELLRTAGLEEELSPLLITGLEGPDDPAAALNFIALGEGPEPFWRIAMRRGLRAAVLFWPEIYPDSPFRADYTVAPASCYSPPYLHPITFTGVISPWTGLPSSFSPPLEGTMDIQDSGGGLITRLRILALDTADDGAANYDAVALEGGSKPLRPGEWVSLEVDHHLHSGAFFKLAEINSRLKKALLYRTSLCYAYALPPSLLQKLNGELGFPPPSPDPESIARGWLTPQDALFFLEKNTEWASGAIALVWEEYRPDLLLARFDLPGGATEPPLAGMELSPQAQVLKNLAKGMREQELLVVLAPGSGGFLAIYGRNEGSVEIRRPLRAEKVASIILSMLLPQ